MFIGNLKVGGRLALAFSVILAGTLGISVFSVQSLKSLSGLTLKLHRHPYTVSTAALRIQNAITAMHRSMKDVVLAKDETARAKAVDKVSQIEKGVFGDFDIIAERFLGNKARISRARQKFTDWKPIRDEVIVYMRAGDREAAARITKEKGAQYIQGLNVDISGLVQFADGKATAFMKGAERKRRSALTMIYGIAAGTMALAVFLAYWVTRSITDPLAIMVDRLKDIAEGEGDLTQRVEVSSKDELGELGRWFNIFVEKVHDIVARVAETTEHVSSATTQLSVTAQEMATGAEEQTIQTAQVATSMEEMSATVQQVAKNALSAAGNAKTSGETAEKGGDVVQKTVQGMRRIADSVTQLQSVIEGLSKNSEKIGEIVGVIDDVADQTNLLALNAAIEAARAGEQGRGFAVVADEVRKLAERTSSSTKEIAGMVKSIQGDTTQAVQSMSSGSKEVAAGVALAEEAGNSLREIVAGAKQVEDMIQQIASSAEEQSAATEEISSNVESIASVVKQNSASARQISSASGELDHLAVELKDLVSQFKLDKKAVQNGNGVSRRSPAVAVAAVTAGEPLRKFKSHRKGGVPKLGHGNGKGASGG